MRKLRSSALKCFLQCPRKYYYSYVIEENYEQTNAQAIGTNLHKILEECRHDINNYSTPEIKSVDEAKTHRMAVEYLNSKNIFLKPIAFEVSFEKDFFTGTIDVLFIDENENWWIGDTKTTSKFDENIIARICKDYQVVIYNHFAADIGAKHGLNINNYAGFKYIQLLKPAQRLSVKETLQEYFERCTSDYKEISLNKERIDSIDKIKPLISDFQDYLFLSLSEEDYHQYLVSCYSFNSVCPFFNRCHNTETNTDVYL